MGRSSLATGPLIRSGSMSRTRTSSDLELLVALDRAGREPLHRQLERGPPRRVRDGRLAPGRALPSTPGAGRAARGLARDRRRGLRAARRRGLSRQPAGRCDAGRARRPRDRSDPLGPTATADLRVRLPARPARTSREFPRAAWLRALRRVLGDGPERAARATSAAAACRSCGPRSATYLNRVRGHRRRPGRHRHLHGLRPGPRARRPGARARAARDGSPSRTRPIRSTASTIRARRAARRSRSRSTTTGSASTCSPATDADAVVVTAAHQYPTGGVLPAERRSALVDWAERARRR